jgi:hypothetical protein
MDVRGGKLKQENEILMCYRHGGNENYWSEFKSEWRARCSSVAKSLPSIVKALGLISGNTHT